MIVSRRLHAWREAAVKSSCLIGITESKQATNANPFVIPSRRLSSKHGNDRGFFGMAGQYIKGFRLKAAQELASKLPEDERRRMEEKSKADQSDNVETSFGGKNEASIEELIAEAKVMEAQRVKGEMEEKYQLKYQIHEAEVEQAVRKRLESDMELQRRQIAFEKWKEDLEREKQQAEAHSDKDVAAITTTSAAEAFGVHPILGQSVCNLGHKRLYLASIDRLASLPVWEKQRFFRLERAKKMADDKAKSLHIGLPGVIGIYERMDGSLAIIDGQHRVGMLKILAEKKGVRKHFDFDKILVEVYSQPENFGADEYATMIFKEINKAQPANLIDLPGAVKAEDLDIINEAVATISDKYAEMFKPSTKCRRPHVNIDNVRNELFLNQVLDRHQIKTAWDLEQWILAQNEKIRKMYEMDEEARKKFEGQAGVYDKAKKYEFYLGLNNTWYNE